MVAWVPQALLLRSEGNVAKPVYLCARAAQIGTVASLGRVQREPQGYAGLTKGNVERSRSAAQPGNGMGMVLDCQASKPSAFCIARTAQCARHTGRCMSHSY